MEFSIASLAQELGHLLGLIYLRHSTRRTPESGRSESSGSGVCDPEFDGDETYALPRVD
jgi:hypothetical protein